MLLKSEISMLNLKYGNQSDLTRAEKVNAQKGMRSYKIG